MAFNISKELKIYDYKIKPSKKGKYITLKKYNFKIKSYMDYSINEALYIPNILSKELGLIIIHNKKQCLFISKKLIDFFDEKLKETKHYKLELDKLNIFINNLNMLISSGKPISSRENDLVWIKNSTNQEIIIYSKSIIEQLKKINNIILLSPSVFSMTKLSENNNDPLVININMVDKNGGKLFDHLTLIYIDKKWRIAVPI